MCMGGLIRSSTLRHHSAPLMFDCADMCCHLAHTQERIHGTAEDNRRPKKKVCPRELVCFPGITRSKAVFIYSCSVQK